MKLSPRVAAELWMRCIAIAKREPDFVIGEDYLRRWFVIPRNPIFNIYLHEFRRSDEDRALHDHPWPNVSILLFGRYVEHTIAAGGVNKRVAYQAGDIKFRRSVAAHRIELTDGVCWSLFITGPRIRSWGFHCAAGWRHWREFTKPGETGKIGKGCE